MLSSCQCWLLLLQRLVLLSSFAKLGPHTGDRLATHSSASLYVLVLTS